MLHLATREQLNAAFLPIPLQIELSKGNAYSTISKKAMEKFGISLQIGEVKLNDETQEADCDLALRWSQSNQLQFVAYNKEAEIAKLQRKIYMKCNVIIPYSLFTPDQLQKLKDRNLNKLHLDWLKLKEGKSGKDYPAYPQNLLMWCTCDLPILYKPDVRKNATYSNGLGFSIPKDVFKGFKDVEFSGLGSGNKSEELVVLPADVKPYEDPWEDILSNDDYQLQTLQVTPEQIQAAMPPIPVFNLPSPVQAAPTNLPVQAAPTQLPTQAAAPAVDPLAMLALLPPEQQAAMLPMLSPEQQAKFFQMKTQQQGVALGNSAPTYI